MGKKLLSHKTYQKAKKLSRIFGYISIALTIVGIFFPPALALGALFGAVAGSLQIVQGEYEKQRNIPGGTTDMIMGGIGAGLSALDLGGTLGILGGAVNATDKVAYITQNMRTLGFISMGINVGLVVGEEAYGAYEYITGDNRGLGKSLMIQGGIQAGTMIGGAGLGYAIERSGLVSKFNRFIGLTGEEPTIETRQSNDTDLPVEVNRYLTNEFTTMESTQNMRANIQPYSGNVDFNRADTYFGNLQNEYRSYISSLKAKNFGKYPPLRGKYTIIADKMFTDLTGQSSRVIAVFDDVSKQSVRFRYNNETQDFELLDSNHYFKVYDPSGGYHAPRIRNNGQTFKQYEASLKSSVFLRSSEDVYLDIEESQSALNRKITVAHMKMMLKHLPLGSDGVGTELNFDKFDTFTGITKTSFTSTGGERRVNFSSKPKYDDNSNMTLLTEPGFDDIRHRSPLFDT